MKHPAILVALAVAAAGAAAAADLGDARVDPAFAKADADRNGTVSRAEARRFGIGARAFKASDPDHDGTLDKKEFGAAVQAQFAGADPDRDGTLDWKEAHKAGIRSKKTFDAANGDRDGTLDIAEFLAALTAQAR